VTQDFSIACFSNPVVISPGTISPRLITDSISAAVDDPDCRSARKSSPAERCTNPASATRRAHCVPFPAPGPPSTKTTYRPRTAMRSMMCAIVSR
jgi:hypothetical protein